MNKRRIRSLRTAWKLEHGGETPAATRGTWGTVRNWVRFMAGSAKRREHEMGIRLSFSRSRRRRMKKAHIRGKPDEARLRPMAAWAFRPKKRRPSGANKADRTRGERSGKMPAPGAIVYPGFRRPLEPLPLLD